MAGGTPVKYGYLRHLGSNPQDSVETLILRQPAHVGLNVP